MIEDLPCLAPQEKFCFACGPSQPCFNRCCNQLSLPLTPYDLIRLCHNLEMPSREFLQTFTAMRRQPETGLPEFHLRMIESPDAPCPFVSPAGCAVYDDRPGACRAYPLGRGARMDKNGPVERFFLVGEDHCCGFGNGPIYTPAEWLASQGMDRYIYFNDRYMRLLSLIHASGSPIPSRLLGMADLSLWQMDNFAELLDKTSLPTQLEGSYAQQDNLHDLTVAGAEARLEFGLSWLELLLFGSAPGLSRKI